MATDEGDRAKRCILQEKMAELVKIRQQLKIAKDSATQSWLESRPLTDELEKRKSILATAKNRIATANAVISELESQLEATNVNIKSKMEGELDVKKLTNVITETSDLTRKELEMIKRKRYEECRVRSKLKQILRIRRQKLRTLQVTLRAVEMEIEAFGSSGTEALGHIKNSETENTSVRMTQEEYYALTEKAKEETALAEWRISLFMKQKLAAEVSRNWCLSRLKELRRDKSKDKEISEDVNTIQEVEKQQSPISSLKDGDKATDKLDQNARKIRRRSRDSNRKKKKKVGKKKKQSIIIQLRSFIVRSIGRFFW